VEAGESVASVYSQASADNAVGEQGADAPQRVSCRRKFARDFSELLFESEPCVRLHADAANVKSSPVAIFSESSGRAERIKAGLYADAFDRNRIVEGADAGFHFDGIVRKQLLAGFATRNKNLPPE
jgi:hypothetical protein